jgi:hypothetical protein
MAGHPQSLKNILNDLSGLRLPPGNLLEAEGDGSLLVARMTKLHKADTPRSALNKQTVHEKCLELMENCHIHRDFMFESSRMDDELWELVQATTSWTTNVSPRIIRTLALKLCQGAWNHNQDPKLDSKGEPRPYCPLAIAALRFAHDIHVYETYMWEADEPMRLRFTEFRGPIYLDNGKSNIGRDGKVRTLPVFPLAALKGLDRRSNLRHRGLSSIYRDTAKEPESFKLLERVPN